MLRRAKSALVAMTVIGQWLKYSYKSSQSLFSLVSTISVLAGLPSAQPTRRVPSEELDRRSPFSPQSLRAKPARKVPCLNKDF